MHFFMTHEEAKEQKKTRGPVPGPGHQTSMEKKKQPKIAQKRTSTVTEVWAPAHGAQGHRSPTKRRRRAPAAKLASKPRRRTSAALTTAEVQRSTSRPLFGAKSPQAAVQGCQSAVKGPAQSTSPRAGPKGSATKDPRPRLPSTGRSSTVTESVSQMCPSQETVVEQTRNNNSTLTESVSHLAPSQATHVKHDHNNSPTVMEAISPWLRDRVEEAQGCALVQAHTQTNANQARERTNQAPRSNLDSTRQQQSATQVSVRTTQRQLQASVERHTKPLCEKKPMPRQARQGQPTKRSPPCKHPQQSNWSEPKYATKTCSRPMASLTSSLIWTYSSCHAPVPGPLAHRAEAEVRLQRCACATKSLSTAVAPPVPPRKRACPWKPARKQEP